MVVINSLMACSVIFSQFIQTYNKTYTNEQEYKQRQAIFCSNYEFIEQHNARNDVNFKMDINSFADLTDQEFKLHYTNNIPIDNHLDVGVIDTQMYTRPLVNSYDWTELGHVSPVKNQGQCGSCWSFSATGVIESHFSIYNNETILLSEQELVDCSWMYGNFGCGGGMPSRAYRYVKRFGLSTEDEYAYAAKGHLCKSLRHEYKDRYHIKGWKNVESFNETRLVELLYNVGPISVALDASSKGFKFYKSGVMDTCGIQLNHAVLLVGYGVEDGQQYFKIKNSWGETWGDDGYIKISRGKHLPLGTCGVTMTPSYPLV